METVIFRVLVASMGLYLIDLLSYGFVLGFGAFFALCVASWLLFWGYSRLVVNRVKPLGVWRLQSFGEQQYWMEVA